MLKGHKTNSMGQKTLIRMRLNQAITALVMLLYLLPGVTFAEKITIRLATGSKTGVYYPLGHGIKNVVESAFADILIEVVETTGTLDNLRPVSYTHLTLPTILLV